MNKFRSGALALVLATAALFSGLLCAAAGAATTRVDLKREGVDSLQALYKISPVALDIAGKAKAVLVFPSVTKAGLVFGGSYGEGVMTKNGNVAGYYSTVSLSWGLQTGAQPYGYAVFLMSDRALRYVDKTEGWEFGIGPTVLLVNEGVAKNLSASALKDDAYAFIFDQQGLMARLSIEGTKITRIAR